MQKTLLILMLALCAKVSFGQITHLEPADGFERYEGILKEYYDGVFPLLYKGYAGKPVARYTVMPAFSTEYSFSIEEFDGSKYLVCNKLSENYWYAKARNKVKVVSNKIVLADSVCAAIVKLFKILEEQTKAPEDNLSGFDGVSYYFTTTDSYGHLKMGKTWSPRKGTLLGKLVEVCDNIHSINFDKKLSQEKILKDVNRLIDKLKE